MNVPPIAPRRPSRRTLHGVAITDDYAWLKDENWQEVLRDPSVLDPDIRSYLEAENRYADAILGPTESLQKDLVREMRGRIKEDDSGVPVPDGPFAYLWRFREGGQHELIGRTKRNGGEEQIVLDGDALAKDSGYFKFGGRRHSPDHRLEAWSADLRGSEYFTIRVRSWETGEDLPDVLTQAGGSVVWGADFDLLFLCPGRRQSSAAASLSAPSGHVAGRRRPGLRGEGLGLVHAHRGERQRPILHHLGRRSRYLRTAGSSTLATRCGTASRRAREKGIHYSVADRGDELFILTNEGGAIDFRIATAPLASPGRAHWHELIPHRPGVYHPQHRVVCRSLGSAGACERAALDRDPRPQ